MKSLPFCSPLQFKLIVTVFFCVSAINAHAEDSGAIQKVCRADFTQFCKSIKPGGGRVVECLNQHQSQLSSSCQEKLKVVSACGEQVKKLCGDEAEPGKLKQCAKEHKTEFSEECRNSIAHG